MKRILYLTFYYKPDLSAGSFRNTTLSNKIIKNGNNDVLIDVVTTTPNRYKSFKVEADKSKNLKNLNITRIQIPAHSSGFFDQSISFIYFFIGVNKLIKNKKYDLVFASSSRLFTAFLGYVVSKRLRSKLYLDIRDIFYETIYDILDKNPLKFLVAKPIRIIEKLTFKGADHVNLISKGFNKYFEKFNLKSVSYFSNGIDEQFLDLPLIKNKKNKVITYAGNIGESQALHEIIPEAAQKLKDFTFQIIGDGSAKPKLITKINKYGLKNIKLINPINRNELIKVYLNSQFNFIHLKSENAFLRVLPSKVFELGAINIPIIAGVSGYSKKFISKNLPSSIIFQPHNSEELVRKIKQYRYVDINRNEFRKKFSRDRINNELSKSILNQLR